MTLKGIKFYILGLIYATFSAVEFIVSRRKLSVTMLGDCYFNFFNASMWFIFAAQANYTDTPVGRHTYGTWRRGPFSKVFMACFTAALYFSVFMDGIQKVFAAQSSTDFEYIIELLVFGTFGIFMNIFTCLLTGVTMECAYETGNMKKRWVVKYSSEIQKVFQSFAVSFLVLGSGLINLQAQGKIPRCIIDGATAMIIVSLHIPTLWSVAKASGYILFECTPEKMDTDLVKFQILKQFPEVIDVHDFHAWQLSPGDAILTAHVVFVPDYANCKVKVNRSGKQVADFVKKHGASKVTLQYEFASSVPSLMHSSCLLNCPQNNAGCEGLKCCLKREQKSPAGA